MIIRLIFPLFLIAAISVLLFQSSKLAILTTNGMIGPGFLPFMLSLLIIFVLLIEVLFIIKSKNQTEQAENQVDKTKLRRQAFFVISIIVTLILIKWIGILFSLGLFIFIMLITIENKKKVHSLIFTLVSILFIYVIFDRFLGISLMNGMY